MKIILTILLLCSPLFAQVLGGKASVGGKMTYGKGAAAITFDAFAQMSGPCAASPCTWTHTLGGVGTHSVLYVMLTGSQSFTSPACTADGSAMTLVANVNDSGASSSATFVITGKSPGAAVAISCSASSISAGYGASASFWGVNQSTPNRTAATAVGGCSGSPSITVSNAVSGDVVIDSTHAFGGSNGFTGHGGSQTQLYIRNDSGNAMNAAASWLTATGSSTLTWTTASSSCWSDVGVALIGG